MWKMRIKQFDLFLKYSLFKLDNYLPNLTFAAHLPIYLKIF